MAEWRGPMAIIGAGTMGTGVALACALSGMTVRVFSRRSATRQASRRIIQEEVEKLVRFGRASADEVQTLVGRIDYTDNLAEAVSRAAFVSENVAEDPVLKVSVLQAVEAASDEHTIITSNTSSLSVDLMSETLVYPGRFLGMHWFNPPHVIPLVEVVAGQKTGADAIQAVHELARRLSKKAVNAPGHVPGFLVNRLQYALLRESLHLLTSGLATREEIDAAVTECMAIRWAAVGPLQSIDMNGLDVVEKVGAQILPSLANDTAVPDIIAERTGQKKLGFKSQTGLEDYSPERIRRILDARDRVAWALLDVKQSLPEDR